MNLHYAQLVEVKAGGGNPEGKIRVGGAIRTVSLALVPDARRGDEVLLCDGMAICRVENQNEKEKNHVPRDTGEA
jgi:hydrogenase maturation factor